MISLRPVPQRAPALGSTRELERAVDRSFSLSWSALLGAAAMVLLVGLLSASSGAAGLPIAGVTSTLIDRLPGVSVPTSLSEQQQAILLQIRLPRLALGMLVGAALGMAGAAFQGVFRNPLADPYLLGVSAGAGFGAVLALGFGLDLGWARSPRSPLPRSQERCSP